MRVLQGEGAVVGAGAKSSRGIIILVTDEAGRPVEGAAVSFHLPNDGSSGVFLSGMRTEIATTGPDGKVSVFGIQWNTVPGPVEIRVTAAKGDARAGLIISQTISDHIVTETSGARQAEPGRGGKGKWLLILVVAAGAGTGAALGLSQSKSTTTVGAGAAVAGAVTATPTIGTPTISVGRP